MFDLSRINFDKLKTIEVDVRHDRPLLTVVPTIRACLICNHVHAHARAHGTIIEVLKRERLV